MPRHADMDYEHWRAHCDDCWDAYVQEKRHRELVEAMERLTGIEKIEVKREYIPLPQKLKPPQPRGGIENIEPV